ncbi:ABC transporter permease [Pseudohoeflea suaedae]|uniref:ABC transporter permease n=1 Tax=Pseudohoeflea suaedae TaxID=877384 RepID=A0A4R5PM24_9HYPH|nr:ABC transporter permease [Pseudohoeflea suaedae]TDH37898.1 ABC transporter permease [Pseudohoeflea suaedae]
MSTDIQSSPAERATPYSKDAITHFIYRYGLLVVLALMIVVFSIAHPFFGTFANAMFILQASAIVAVVGLGCTISMTVGGFDLAVGATMSLVVMVAAGAMVIYGFSGPVAILLGLAAGLLAGLLNAMLIVYARIPDLVATLAAQFLVSGTTLLAVNGQSISEGMSLGTTSATGTFAPIFKWLGSGYVFGVHSSVIVAGLVFLAVFALLNLTKWGRIFYAIGGNPVAAAAVGIPVRRYRIIAYLLSGLLSAVAGLLLVARSNRGDVSVGDAYLLQAVSAALVGYAVLGANRANAFGTLIGAVFVATLINGLTMFNFPYYAQTFVQGLLLGVALLMSYTLGPKSKR